MEKFTNQKRKKSKDKDNNYSNNLDEDYNIYYDKQNTHLKDNKDNPNDFNQVINVDFLFSEIRSSYFFGIKNFLEGLLDFSEFDASGLSDLILEEKDFLGTVIKTELEEDSGNDLPDLYALATLIPYDFFNNINALNQILRFCSNKIDENNSQFKLFLEAFLIKYQNKDTKDSKSNSENKENEDSVVILKKLQDMQVDLSKFKLGVFINERVSNLPQPLVAPLFNLLKQDILNFKEANDNNTKYDFTHILYITK